MANNLKQMIKQINDGNNLEEYLPIYANKYLSANYQYSLLRFAMEYYILYQVTMEEENPLVNQAKTTIDFISKAISDLFSDDFKIEAAENLIEELDAIRNENITKMNILTCYADKLQIYEYVLNRIEPKFEKEHESIDESVFLQKLISYIFGSKDNVIINDNIKEVIGQMPIRMTKEKYFEILKNSLSIYKGSDKSSVETYLYMLRTSAMLYRPEETSEYFTDLQDTMNHFEKFNYNQITEEEYRLLEGEYKKTAEQLVYITDLYSSLQELINNLYCLVLGDSYIIEPDSRTMGVCKEIIRDINTLFIEGKSTAIPETLEKKLSFIEGEQEKLFADISLLGSVLHHAKINYEKIIESLMLSPLFDRLLIMDKLLSSSIFIDLNKKESDEEADESYIENVTRELISEFRVLFNNYPKCVNRAIIANTIDKMPVFFNSSDEIVNYLKFSLEQCHDRVEKYASIALLNKIMTE